MSKLIVQGMKRLQGELWLHGAKNSALPLLAAALLGETPSVIHNCPRLSDVDVSVRILEWLGCKVTWEDTTVIVDPSGVNRCDIPDQLMREMRSSVVFLGAIVSRCGSATVSYPGGCELGPRPIDLHLSALRQLGLRIEEGHGELRCSRNGPLVGRSISLSFPSVGATENVLLAAATATGTTTLFNAAREPEISDLADFLNGCGAKITGAGEGVIHIDGVRRLTGTEHTVIPDRIVASTYLAAAAMTQGRLLLHNVIPAHLATVLPAFEEAGCDLVINGKSIELTAPPRLHAIRTVRTMPYPGFPTDAQPPIMAMAAVADGTSLFIENIFESRFKHVGELERLGTRIKVEGRVAVVEGVHRLSGAPVEATDLRGGAALVLAGLAAEGTTEIGQICHIDRGYEKIEGSLSGIGARIERIDHEQRTSTGENQAQNPCNGKDAHDAGAGEHRE